MKSILAVIYVTSNKHVRYNISQVKTRSTTKKNTPLLGTLATSHPACKAMVAIAWR